MWTPILGLVLLAACDRGDGVTACPEDATLELWADNATPTAEPLTGDLEVVGGATTSHRAAVLRVTVAGVGATTTDGFLSWGATVPLETLQALAADDGTAGVHVVAVDLCGTTAEQVLSVAVDPAAASDGGAADGGTTDGGTTDGGTAGDTGG
ncbi:hypothetical protein L6R53_27065 [Myxococcota bacterium]|nr:hypothetical protein [Myxococcota bacterium]